MTRKTNLKAAIAALIALLGSGTTLATPVSYYGAIFDLSIVDTGALGGTYQVTYSADFSNFTNSLNQPFIDAIAWKHAGSDVATATLTSFPSTSSGGWLTGADSTVNANGCSANGGTTWACTLDSTSPYSATTGGLLSWVFDVTFSSDLINLDTTGDSIKARFVDANGNKQGALLSCTLSNNDLEDNCDSTTKVPEPGSLMLLSLGLLGIGSARHFSFKKKMAAQAR